MNKRSSTSSLTSMAGIPHSCRDCRQSHCLTSTDRRQARHSYQKMNITPRFTNSSIYLLGLLTWAVVMIQAFATSPSSPSHNTFARNNQWGVSRGGSSSVALSKQRPSSSLKSLAEDSNEVKASKEIPHIRPYNGVSVNSKEQQSKLYVKVDIPKGEIAETSAKKTIVTPGGFADTLLPATYVAETNLPTDIGHFRIRAYRINGIDAAHPLGAGAGLGSEPCIIYCTDKPPFGKRNGERATGVPVRIHDQCFTSEVFRSQRCVQYTFHFAHASPTWLQLKLMHSRTSSPQDVIVENNLKCLLNTSAKTVEP